MALSPANENKKCSRGGIMEPLLTERPQNGRHMPAPLAERLNSFCCVLQGFLLGHYFMIVVTVITVIIVCLCQILYFCIIRDVVNMLAVYCFHTHISFLI